MAVCAQCGDALPGSETYHTGCYVVDKIRLQEDLPVVPVEDILYVSDRYPEDSKVPARLKWLDTSPSSESGGHLPSETD